MFILNHFLRIEYDSLDVINFIRSLLANSKNKNILEDLGFSNKEINKWIPKLYNALVLELEALKKLK